MSAEEEPVQDVDVSMQDEEQEELDTEKIKIVCLMARRNL